MYVSWGSAACEGHAPLQVDLGIMLGDRGPNLPNNNTVLKLENETTYLQGQPGMASLHAVLRW